MIDDPANSLGLTQRWLSVELRTMLTPFAECVNDFDTAGFVI
jgi:hypothetical protein